MDISAADPAQAMAATLDHLGRRELAEAETAMAGVSDAALYQLGFPAYFEPFRAAGFKYGESRIAPLFKTYGADNIWLRIRGVDCLTETGAVDCAVAELADLVLMDAAPAHAGMLLACFTRLERLDLASAFAQRLVDSEALPPAVNIQIGFEIATALGARRHRGPQVRELSRLEALCAGQLEPSIQLAELYMSVGDLSFARRVLERLDGPAADTPQAKLCLIQAIHGGNRGTLAAALYGLAAEPSDDSSFWLKLSYVADAVGAAPLALDAARKSLAHAPDDKVWARIRMVQVLVADGQRRAALAEIEGLLSNDQAMKFSGQTLADLAVVCERPALAVSIAQRWRGLCPADVQALAMLCGYERKAGNEAGVHAAGTAVVEWLQQGAAFTPEQFRLVLDNLRESQAAMRMQVAQLAVGQYPDSAEFAAIAKPSALAAKLFGLEASGALAAKRIKRPGLLSRLGLGRS